MGYHLGGTRLDSRFQNSRPCNQDITNVLTVQIQGLPLPVPQEMAKAALGYRLGNASLGLCRF